MSYGHVTKMSRDDKLLSEPTTEVNGNSAGDWWWWWVLTRTLLKSSFIDDGEPIRQNVHLLDIKWD